MKYFFAPAKREEQGQIGLQGEEAEDIPLSAAPIDNWKFISIPNTTQSKNAAISCILHFLAHQTATKGNHRKRLYPLVQLLKLNVFLTKIHSNIRYVLVKIAF